MSSYEELGVEIEMKLIKFILNQMKENDVDTHKLYNYMAVLVIDEVREITKSFIDKAKSVKNPWDFKTDSFDVFEQARVAIVLALQEADSVQSLER